LLSLLSSPDEPDQPAPQEDEAPEAVEASEASDEETPPEAETTEESEEAEPAPPQTYKVKADGEEVEVPLEELLKGYSRTADYTRKTQRLAEERKAFEAESKAIRDAKEQYAQRITQLDDVLSAETPQEPDWDKVPDEDFARVHAAWERSKAKRDAVKAERTRLHREQEEGQQREYEAKLQAEFTRLVEVIPDFGVPDKASTLRGKLVEIGQVYGYTSDEIASTSDHRAVRLLHDAMLYRELQAKRKELKPTPVETPTVKPGTRSTKTERRNEVQEKAYERLKKSGSVFDAQKLFETMVE